MIIYIIKKKSRISSESSSFIQNCVNFLYIYQSGVLKAKVPVVKMEVFETSNPKQEKVKKMSWKKYNKQHYK